MELKSKSVVIIAVLLVTAFFALILSYYSISKFKSNLKASLICKGDRAILKLINHGDGTRVFYVSITEGDEILSVKRIGTTLKRGGILLIDLRIPDDKVEISVILERGVISGLKCGVTEPSEP